MCMTFYRRDGHVIELQTGSAVSRPEEACSPPHFLQHSMPFLTLVSEYSSFSFDVACAFPFVSSTKLSLVLLRNATMPLLTFQRKYIAISSVISSKLSRHRILPIFLLKKRL